MKSQKEKKSLIERSIDRPGIELEVGSEVIGVG